MNPDETQIIPPAQQVVYMRDDDDADEMDSDLDTVCEITPLLDSADGEQD